MRKISILGLILSLFISSFAIANEVNIFNARHYKADAELYDKFTAATGIKVNLIKVLPKVEGPITEAHFVYPESLRNVARVQAFRNFLYSKISEWEF